MKRRVKKTILIVGEGKDEEVFLKYLRQAVQCSDEVDITIKQGKGGSPRDIVHVAVKDFAAYDHKLVMLDSGPTRQAMLEAKEYAGSSVQFLINTPCLEALLLSILEKDKDYSNKKESECKKIFETNYIPKNRRDEFNHYAKHFPLKLLQNRRKVISILDTIMRIVETGEFG
ncbi:hypothetical protein HGA88_03780 [Candidatus Roizmanbacteria bacterium]|nr:hypothetical protein [Candidatus Roizmanbacteria bacterium]